MFSQYQSCRWPGDEGNHSIRSHGMDLSLSDCCSLNTRRAEIYRCVDAVIYDKGTAAGRLIITGKPAVTQYKQYLCSVVMAIRMNIWVWDKELHNGSIWNAVLSHWSTHHDDVTKWRHFPRYWPFVRIINRSPLSSPLICAWTNGWANTGDAGDFRGHHAQYSVTVMSSKIDTATSRPSQQLGQFYNFPGANKIHSD